MSRVRMTVSVLFSAFSLNNGLSLLLIKKEDSRGRVRIDVTIVKIRDRQYKLVIKFYQLLHPVCLEIQKVSFNRFTKYIVREGLSKLIIFISELQKIICN